MKTKTTVAELLQMLEGLDPQAEVLFSYQYGDHWNTVVAQGIEDVSEGVVEYSEYHRQDKVVDADEGDEIQDKARKVIIIS